MKKSKPEIAVIGAGAVGLSTALCIKQTIPSVNVTVVADKFLDETLSYGAGGFFRPEVNIGKDRSTIKQWASDSYERYSLLARAEPESGNSFVSGYQLSSYSADSMRNELIEAIVPEPVRNLTASEMSRFPAHFKYGIAWNSIITDPRYYLPYLQKKFDNLGGRLLKQHIDSFEEFFIKNSSYDLLVNCTGFEASRLTDDHLIIPVRGQAFKVKADWIKNFYFADGAYVLPGRDYVTVGELKSSVAAIRHKQIIHEWVGIRPHRQPVRVELEQWHSNRDSSLRRIIVHNYGHGAHGITLSWGTAIDATRLVLQGLTNAIAENHRSDNHPCEHDN
ncbi:D-aspartate oxidase [Sarcoptes scabiei]|uniref:D-aspartate oxidase n=1 Tax=Sarcoptes scabiei TaxID=52283 RepID=A0A834QYK2_SARSC|nr:D-aspartate oxidase [Sarcoptes scabiei]